MARIFGPEWKYLTADGDLNFHGAVKKYFEIINTDVLEYIKDIYHRTYLNIIFPLISQDDALIDFDYDHIDRILKLIQNERGLLDQTIKRLTQGRCRFRKRYDIGSGCRKTLLSLQCL